MDWEGQVRDVTKRIGEVEGEIGVVREQIDIIVNQIADVKGKLKLERERVTAVGSLDETGGQAVSSEEESHSKKRQALEREEEALGSKEQALRSQQQALREKEQALRNEKQAWLDIRRLQLQKELGAESPASCEAGQKVVVITFVRTKMEVHGPPDMTLDYVCQEMERKWAFFQGAAYEFRLSPKTGALQEMEWQKVLQTGADLKLRVKPLGMPFSSYRQSSALSLRVLLKEQLGVLEMARDVVPAKVNGKLFNQLEFPLNGCIVGTTTYEDMLTVLTEGLSLKLEAMGEMTGQKEQPQRDMISEVFVGAVLLARASIEDTTDDILLEPEKHVVGRLGWGPIDYVIMYRSLLLIIAEAKRYHPDQAWAQVIAQIAAVRDTYLRRIQRAPSTARKRKHYEAFELDSLPTFAVLCTSTVYRLVQYTPPSSQGQQGRLECSLAIPLSILKSVEKEKRKDELKALIEHLAAMVVKQLAVVDSIANHMPSIQSIDPCEDDRQREHVASQDPDLAAEEDDEEGDH